MTVVIRGFTNRLHKQNATIMERNIYITGNAQ